jgi:hypothetical protein
MRYVIALVLIPAVLAQGCATTATSSHASSQRAGASAGQGRAADPARLQEISDDLAGEPATIELASGEVVQKAQSVRIGSEVTSWYDATGRERSVPTAEVRRVLQEQRHLIGRGFGYGAAIGVLPGFLVAQNGQSCGKGGCGIWSGADAYAAGLLIVIGSGLIGMVAAAANRHPVVVYAGPPPPRTAGAGVGDAAGAPEGAAPAIQHCRLSPSAAGGPLVCAPSTR